MYAQKKIGILTVNYKQESYLEKFIKSCDENDVYILNNCPIEKSNEYSLKMNNVFVFESESNLGYFGGFNYLIGKLKKKYDYLVFSNPDVKFNSNFFNKLNVMDVNNDIFVVAPNIKLVNGITQNPHLIIKPNYFRRNYYKILYSNYFVFSIINILKKFKKKKVKNVNNDECEIFMAHGSCFILTHNFWEHFNNLYCKSFLWGEEAFLKLQLNSVCGKILYKPDLILTHYEHSATNKISNYKKFKLMKKSYKLYKSIYN